MAEYDCLIRELFLPKIPTTAWRLQLFTLINMTDSPPSPHKIAIIGAGIAGPVLALTILSNPILRQRYKPVIYERLSCPRPTPDPNATTDASSKATYAAGAAVALTSNALFPLYSLGLAPALNTISCETSRIKIWRAWGGKDSGQHKYLNQINSPNWQEDLGTCLRIVERAKLQALVLEKVKELGGEVVFGKKVTDLQMMEDGVVKLLFEEGDEDKVGLVVGADGGWSGVRRNIIALANGTSKSDGSRVIDANWIPEFAGADGLYGVSKRMESSCENGDEAREGDTHWVFLDSGMASTWALPEGRQFWTISFLSKKPPARGLRSEEIPKQEESEVYGADVTLGGYKLEETEQILSKYENSWHPVAGNFGELFRSSERIVRTPLWYRAWEAHEIRGKNVVLIGDAARLMLPSSGQGIFYLLPLSQILTQNQTLAILIKY